MDENALVHDTPMHVGSGSIAHGGRCALGAGGNRHDRGGAFVDA